MATATTTDITTDTVDIRCSDILARFVHCYKCDHVWRTFHTVRCPKCAQAYGIDYQLDKRARSEVLEAIDAFGTPEEGEDERYCLVRAMVDHCPWYGEDDPWFSQISYLYLREHLRDHPSSPQIKQAMDIFYEIFEDRVRFVDARGGWGHSVSPHPSPWRRSVPTPLSVGENMNP